MACQAHSAAAARTSVKHVSTLRHARLQALQAPAVGEDAAPDGQGSGVGLAQQAAAIRQERPVRPLQPALSSRQCPTACPGPCTHSQIWAWHIVDVTTI